MSLLAGQNGRHTNEITRLIDWIRQQPPFDIINLDSTLLSGLAPALQDATDARIVCTVQGEDNFLEAMGDETYFEARRLIRENAAAVKLFIATGRTYAREMTEFLGAAPARVRPVWPGLANIETAPHEPRQRFPFTVGYLGAIKPRKGLDLLLDAFEFLICDERRDLHLAIGGPVLNTAFWRQQKNRFRAPHFAGRIRYDGALSENEKLPWLSRLSVLAVPSLFPDCRGMTALEAQACGVPVLAPSWGIFPEMFEATQGGLLFTPGDAYDLGASIRDFMEQPDLADTMGASGRSGVQEYFQASRMAAEVEGLYEALLNDESATAILRRTPVPTAGEPVAPPAASA